MNGTVTTSPFAPVPYKVHIYRSHWQLCSRTALLPILSSSECNESPLATRLIFSFKFLSHSGKNHFIRNGYSFILAINHSAYAHKLYFVLASVCSFTVIP